MYSSDTWHFFFFQLFFIFEWFPWVFCWFPCLSLKELSGIVLFRMNQTFKLWFNLCCFADHIIWPKSLTQKIALNLLFHLISLSSSSQLIYNSDFQCQMSFHTPYLLWLYSLHWFSSLMWSENTIYNRHRFLFTMWTVEHLRISSDPSMTQNFSVIVRLGFHSLLVSRS